MKKNILYLLLAFVAVIFASCNPLKDSINDIKPDPNGKTIAITVTDTYASTEAANIGIAATLNKSYAHLPDNTKANVTYSYKTNTVKPVDSVYNNIQYTVTASDYADGASVVGNNSNKNYNATQVLSFLEYKYPQANTPVNKLVLLTYNFFQSGVTPSGGSLVTEAFLLQSIGWQKIYLISASQYAALNRGVNNAFVSADAANLASYFNTFLKADPTVMLTAKADDIKYITYKVFVSATVSHQKLYILKFDGTNWLPNTTLGFLKQHGKWIADPAIYYVMGAADYTNLNIKDFPYTFGTTANRGNAAQYKSFNLTATNGTQWTLAEVNAALIYTLNLKFPNAVPNPEIPYVITYNAYASGKYTLTPVKFFRTATGFVLADQ